MNCSVCGKELGDKDLLCQACGAPAPEGSGARSPGGNISTGDVGMIKDSTFHSETNADSHNMHNDSHDIHQDSHNLHNDSHEVHRDSHDVANDSYNVHQNSHNMTFAPAGGGSQTIVFGNERDAKATKTGERCPICGRLAKDDYFYCKSCGRDFICLLHQNRQTFLCCDCSPDVAPQLVKTAEAEPRPLDSAGKLDEIIRLGEEKLRIEKRKDEEAESKRIEAEKSRKRTRATLAALVVAVLIVAIGYAAFTRSAKDKPAASAGVLQTGPTTAVGQAAGQNAAQKEEIADAVAPTAILKPVQAATPKKAQTSQINVATAASETSKRPQTSSPASPAAVNNPQPKDDALDISVNFIGQRESAGGIEPITVVSGGVLRTNDNLKIYINPSRDAYIYVLIFDSEGKAGMLFPSARISMNNHVRGGKTYPVPDGAQWFYLDENTGTETVYVLASLKPMADIDKLLSAMESKGQTQQQEDSRKILAQMEVLKRGVRGIKTGPAHNYKTSAKADIKSVTQIVEGSGSVVWSLSFKHI